MNSPRIIVILILAIILISLGLIEYFNIFPKFSNYTVNIFTEVLGILITVWIVDYLFSKHTEKLRKKAIIEQLSRANKVFSTYLKSFKRYAYFVVTPLNRRKYSLDVALNKDFIFQDMCDLLGPSGMTTDNFDEPVVLKCLEMVKNLKNCSEMMLYNSDLDLFPELSKVLIAFVELISKVNIDGGIKYDALACFMHNNEPIRNVIEKSIKEFKGEPKPLGSNSLDKYVALYYLLKGLAILTTQYEIEINKVLSHK